MVEMNEYSLGKKSDKGKIIKLWFQINGSCSLVLLKACRHIYLLENTHLSAAARLELFWEGCWDPGP